jgi:hypothetical protein
MIDIEPVCHVFGRQTVLLSIRVTTSLLLSQHVTFCGDKTPNEITNVLAMFKETEPPPAPVSTAKILQGGVK